MGVFVQVNEGRQNAKSLPIGYVIQENACWEWIGHGTDGYGLWYVNGKYRRPHRVLYEQTHGAVPAGLVLDHLCRNRRCVNPAHLEAVTNRVNILRGVGAPAVNARKTHCKRGHLYTNENLCPRKDGQRRCRLCRRTTDLAAYHKSGKTTRASRQGKNND